MLCRLQLWGECRQKEQMDMLGHPQLQTGMPSCSVQHQHDLLLGSRSHSTSKRLQLDGKQV